MHFTCIYEKKYLASLKCILLCGKVIRKQNKHNQWSVASSARTTVVSGLMLFKARYLIFKKFTSICKVRKGNSKIINLYVHKSACVFTHVGLCTANFSPITLPDCHTELHLLD